VQITQSASSAFFQVGSTFFSVKLVDAQFPPYNQVIPQKTDKLVRAPRTSLADALRAVSVAASERTGGVKFSFEAGTLRISSESPESGDGMDEVPVEYTGPTVNIGFNAKYFLDILAALTEDEVTLSLNGELDPVLLRPDSDRQFQAVVMPMRI
jgi:DNA polymerase-3 subunit beta